MMASSAANGQAASTGDEPRPKTAEGLDVDSYTAHRLQHATPEHLHLTTRRCFIGPIPEAWLSKHRKSWYKYRPHFSTYSSKTATFNAGHDVDSRTEVDGLDGASQTPKYKGPSFPQPDDVDQPVENDHHDNDEEEHVNDNQEDLAEDTSVLEPVPIPQDSGKVKQVTFGAVGDEPKRRRQKGESSKKSIFATRSRKSSGGSGGGTSFVTARETMSRGSDGGLPGDSGNSTSSLLPRNSGEREVSQAGQSPSATLQSGLRSGGNGKQREDSPTEAKDGASGNDGNVDSHPDPATLLDDNAGEEAAAGLRNVLPISTGLVRFAVPEQPESPDVQLESRKRRSLKDFLKPQPDPGDLIKAERMLVRVDWTKHDLPENFTENDSLKTESKAVEKWREFIVVCRKATEDVESEYILQMTKTRVITTHDRQHTRKQVAHEVPLIKNKTRVNMFSSLDKTIVLWTPWKRGTRTYILRPSSSASSVEWFTFLNTSLGWTRAQDLTVNVPDLNVTLSLTKPFQALDRAREKALNSTDNPTESLTHLAEGVVARDIIDRCLTMLKKSGMSDAASAWFENDMRFGLAWKRYDRLEWVHGANEARMYGTIAMQQSHDLELRPKQHYPTRAIVTKKKTKESVDEPTPIEGFLVRLTSQKGNHSRLGKTFFKRLYYSTQNQYLCFSLPSKAIPPKPPRMPQSSGDNVPSASEIAERVPLIYAVNPYPIKDGKISWLGGQTASLTKKNMDNYAYEESERQVKNLLDTQGYVNMTHIVRVRKMPTDSSAPPEPGEQHSPHDSAEELSDEEGVVNETQTQDIERTFEITLKNGLLLRLQAYDKQARKEWVKRLRKLVRYWKARVSEDTDLYKLVRQQNLEILDIDEEMESILGQFAQKWEVSKSFASPELFNMCGISCCRPITMAGVLYRKPRLHSTFKRCSIILCHGKLLIFQSTLRAHSGVEVPHIHHERQEVVDLKDTYVYSGLITENDLLYQNKTFDSNRPGHHALPRYYLEDSWTSVDEDTMTCFVIWHGKSKSWFKANAKQDDGRMKQKVRYVSSLGRPGRSMVFKCRSRAERDHWVMNINMEIERLQQAADIRVVTG